MPTNQSLSNAISRTTSWVNHMAQRTMEWNYSTIHSTWKSQGVPISPAGPHSRHSSKKLLVRHQNKPRSPTNNSSASPGMPIVVDNHSTTRDAFHSPHSLDMGYLGIHCSALYNKDYEHNSESPPDTLNTDSPPEPYNQAQPTPGNTRHLRSDRVLGGRGIHSQPQQSTQLSRFSSFFLTEVTLP